VFRAWRSGAIRRYWPGGTHHLTLPFSVQKVTTRLGHIHILLRETRRSSQIGGTDFDALNVSLQHVNRRPAEALHNVLGAERRGADRSAKT